MLLKTFAAIARNGAAKLGKFKRKQALKGTNIQIQ
jgi:hypothetical protein